MKPLQPLAIPLAGVHLIEASAGTGKTYTIATLYLRLLLERKLSVRQILVVTYTVAATEELRDRLRARMCEALHVLQGGETEDELLHDLLGRLDDPAEVKRHLTDELTCIDEAAVFTIHGFCQRTLQENAFESGTLFDAQLLENENELISGVVEDYWRRNFHTAGMALAAMMAERASSPSELHALIRDYVTRSELEILPEIVPSAVEEQAFFRLHACLAALWNSERDAIVTLLNECKDLSRGPYKLKAVADASVTLTDYFHGLPEPYLLPRELLLFTQRELDDKITPAKKNKGIKGPRHEFFAMCEELTDLRQNRILLLLRDSIVQVRAERARRKGDLGLLAFDDLLAQLRCALEGSQGDTLGQRLAARYPVALIDEFQDTDSEQYRIFFAIYGTRPESAFFMIGDPKQAIYSFRGADVFTYMAAKDRTHADSRYTLDTNWRSSRALVDGITAIFSGCDAPFIYDGHIDFHRVNASGKADEAPLTINGDTHPPLRIWFVPATEENRAKKVDVITKEWLNASLPELCAEEIVRLLNAGARGEAHLGEIPLQPRHIAVLVRNHHQATAMQQALRARKVNSAYYGRESVYQSEEAGELERVLIAIAEPSREGVLRSALCSRLWGFDGAQLTGLLQDEEAWELLFTRVQEYQRQWLQHGFMYMFRAWLHDEKVAPRLLALDDGERRLTNLLQLGELLQQATRAQHGIERLLRWFAEQRTETTGENEEQQLRLESDEDLVKIVTIHKSKGLEYPVVFLPFAWGARPVEPGPVLFHDPLSRRLSLDLAGDDATHALADQERLAEELRLLYVALTRAKYLCYLPWGRFNGAEHGALAWLLHGGRNFSRVEDFADFVFGLDEEALRSRVEALERETPHSIAVMAPPAITGSLFIAPQVAPQAYNAYRMGRMVRSDWRVTSYSALSAAGHEGASERPDYGSAREDTAAGEAGDERRTLLNFPRGSRAGTFMHRLLENIDFPNARGDTLRQTIERELARSGYDGQWLPAMEEMVSNLLDTPLLPGLMLRDVTTARRLIELEFHYPLRHVAAADLERVAVGFSEYRSDTPSLQFGTVNGIMRGFVDLVFEHEGRYFIADYKSNHLGTQVEDYGPEALRVSVRAHRYDLQYLIYTVALHRYLSQRMPGYEYERHFGGVFYLFLRGMSPAQPGLGIFADRPEKDSVTALDNLFAGRVP